MASVRDEIEGRIRVAIGRALGPSDPSIPLAMGLTPGWDSMGHMTVVLELEREFQVTFPAYRLPELVDMASIVRAIEASVHS